MKDGNLLLEYIELILEETLADSYQQVSTETFEKITGIPWHKFKHAIKSTTGGNPNILAHQSYYVDLVKIPFFYNIFSKLRKLNCKNSEEILGDLKSWGMINGQLGIVHPDIIKGYTELMTDRK